MTLRIRFRKHRPTGLSQRPPRQQTKVAGKSASEAGCSCKLKWCERASEQEKQNLRLLWDEVTKTKMATESATVARQSRLLGTRPSHLGSIPHSRGTCRLGNYIFPWGKDIEFPKALGGNLSSGWQSQLSIVWRRRSRRGRN
jgi:hypothetical protein